MATPAEAQCHHFRIWHYLTPQRCHIVALANPTRSALRARTTREQILDIPIPKLEFGVYPEGDERLKGIAKLRDLDKDAAPQ